MFFPHCLQRFKILRFLFYTVLAGKHQACANNNFSLFFEKETPSVGKIENLLSQYNCYRSAICHNLVLLTFLLFGPIYRRNKSGRLEVRVSVYDNNIKIHFV